MVNKNEEGKKAPKNPEFPCIFHVLKCIGEKQSHSPISELEKELNVPKSTVVRAVNRLIEMRLIERILVNNGDRIGREIIGFVISPLGVKCFEEWREYWLRASLVPENSDVITYYFDKIFSSVMSIFGSKGLEAEIKSLFKVISSCKVGLIHDLLAKEKSNSEEQKENS